MGKLKTVLKCFIENKLVDKVKILVSTETVGSEVSFNAYTKWVSVKTAEDESYDLIDYLKELDIGLFISDNEVLAFENEFELLIQIISTTNSIGVRVSRSSKNTLMYFKRLYPNVLNIKTSSYFQTIAKLRQLLPGFKWIYNGDTCTFIDRAKFNALNAEIKMENK